MRITRRAATAATAVVCVLSLDACGAGTGGTDTSSASGKVQGTITFETWNLRATYMDYFTGLIKDFEKEYPGTHVNWVDQPADGYAQKLSSDATAGTLPDVVNASPDLVAPLAKAGLALDLDQAAGQYRKEYLPGAWNGFQMPGTPGTYAFPWYLNTGPMFYNKRLFQQAGLDPDQPPTTYDQLFADAQTMAKKSSGKIAMLASAPQIEDFGRYGVQLTNKQGTAFTFDNAKGVELLTRYKQLYDAKALDPQALTMTPDQSGQKFMQQAVAMNPGSANNLDDFRKNAPSLYGSIGISAAVNNTGKDNMYLQGLMVNAASKQKPAAVAFAHFVTGARNQMSFAKAATVFPSTTGSLNDPFFTKEDGSDDARVRIAAAKSLATAVNYTPVDFSDQMKTELADDVALALQGKSSPKAALDKAVSQCDQLLKQG